MKDPNRYQSRYSGTTLEIARECYAGDCDVLVWPTESPLHLCLKHKQLYDAYQWAWETNENLLSAHCMLTGRTFATLEHRDRYRDTIFIPALISGKRRGLGWDLPQLLDIIRTL